MALTKVQGLGLGSLDDNITFSTAGKGVHLGVTSATASNLIDDYEEGTWSPVLNGAGGGTDAGVGSYVIIGKTILLSADFANIGTGLSGNLSITGIPVTINPQGTLSMYVPLQFFNLNWDNSAKAVYGYIADSSSTMTLYYSLDGSNSSIVQGSHLASSTFLRFVQTLEIS
jgi:hypothetical protein